MKTLTEFSGTIIRMAARAVAEARKQQVDIIGLSGLITPSLDEMVHVAREMERGVAKVASQRQSVIWVREMVPRSDVIQLYTHAAVFCCPSVYEPFGIINLEPLACQAAVVAAAVGGIPEVVGLHETVFRVDPHPRPGPFAPADPAACFLTMPA